MSEYIEISRCDGAKLSSDAGAVAAAATTCYVLCVCVCSVLNECAMYDMIVKTRLVHVQSLVSLHLIHDIVQAILCETIIIISPLHTFYALGRSECVRAWRRCLDAEWRVLQNFLIKFG